ncbi:MAG: tetratricopeptide repeat protein [Bdellovibrio sp.]
MLKKDPFAEAFQAICKGFQVQLSQVTAKDLQPFVRSFKEAFRQFKKGGASHAPPLSAVEEEELQAFVPESYSSCPCASGKKFKFCCQKAFKEITFAMCAAEEGDLDEALRFMKQAEEKVGRTAEIVCRYAICWSFFEMEKFVILLNEALQINSKHPRANYIMGIEAVADEEYEKAVVFYQTAIDNYPPEDRFHLNETYNNLGTAYCGLKKFKEAKDVWEKALVLLPSDQMVRRNLFEFIYNNPAVPNELRKVSPFIEKYLAR